MDDASLSLSTDRQQLPCEPVREHQIGDAIEDWKARKAWTFEFFKSRYGNHMVSAYRYRGDKYQPSDVTKMTLSDYIDGVVAQDWKSFPYYIRYNWALLADHPELAKTTGF